MLRDDIKPGTRIWHSRYGAGTYLGKANNLPDMAEVDFDKYGRVTAYREYMTEMDGGR